QGLSLRFFDAHTHGELMSRLTNDLENINIVLTENVTNFLASVLIVIGVIATMLALNVWMAAITLVIVPAMAVLTRFVARNTRQGFRDQQAALGELNGLVEEAIDGVEAVRAYNREEAFIAAFEGANARLRESSIHAQTYAGLLGPLGNVVNNAGFALIAGAGGLLVISGRASVGNMASFLTYAQQLRRPINGISNLFNTIQSALAGAERVFEILDQMSDLPDVPDAVPLEQLRGDVVFDDVSFAYEENVPVLRQVSLHARPGQTVALVGPTGAGKTTIINLLSRFYDIDAGSIRIDGHDIRQVRKADLRRQLGVVLQDTYLFAESVMENIRYGRLDATDEEVYAAAALANADHFIRRLPQGYHTVLSERADNLSQGQRQLLAIARAVLADPGILILDEATSSVDTRTEKQIQEALLRLMEGRTAFVIAHRLSTIRDADQILVINNGEIVERGSHEALLAARGFYYRLYVSQFKGQASAA
ncbi:MAG: ABC transporter ATP-binding protein, partial [Anaerolineae bacterium]|nr:ABC transporter ATP-binding protein [Anaerolineae bacterium]